jgi:SAM-dependent methyltransferase
MRLNLGCGRDTREGWVNIDSVDLPGIDHVIDLNEGTFPFEDDSVDYSELIHVIEHLTNPLHLMEELWRVTKPGCAVRICCPHGASDDAWEDPTHVRPYYPGSFLYFAQPTYWRADYGYRGDWDVHDMKLVAKMQFSNEQLAFMRNVVHEIQCTMVTVKPIRPPERRLMKQLTVQKVLLGRAPDAT